MRGNMEGYESFEGWKEIRQLANKVWKWLPFPNWVKIIIFITLILIFSIAKPIIDQAAKTKTDQVLSDQESKRYETVTPTPTPNLLGCAPEWRICSNFNDGKWKGKEKFVIQNPEEPPILSAPIKGNTGAMMYYEEKIAPNNVFLLKAKPLGEIYFGLVLFEYGHAVRCILGDGDRRVIRCFTSIENEWIKKMQGYLPQDETILPGTEIEAKMDMKLISNNTLSIKIYLTYIIDKDTPNKMFSLSGEIPLPILLNETEKRDIGVGLVDTQRKRDIEAEFIQFNIKEE